MTRWPDLPEGWRWTGTRHHGCDGRVMEADGGDTRVCFDCGRELRWLGWLNPPRHPAHTHKWQVDAANGATSKARCRCGVEREFANSPEAVRQLTGAKGGWR